MQDQRPAARAERRGDAGEKQPGARLNQRLPRRILEGELRGRRMLAVVDDAAGSRQRSGFIEHQPQAGIIDPPDPAGVDPVPPRLAIDDTAEGPGRQSRHPGDTTSQPREQTADVEFAAADPDLEKPRLVEPLIGGRGEPHQRLAQRQQIVAKFRRKAHPRGPSEREAIGPAERFVIAAPPFISDASLSQEPVTRNLFLARSYSGEASSPAGLTHGLSPLLSLRAQRSNLGISRDQTIEIASSPAAPRNDRGRARRVRSEGDQLPGDRLAVGDQSLVIDFDKTLARQHRAQCSISRAYCRWATTRSASAQAKSIISLKNVKYIERQVSTGWRRQWMIRASGSLRDRRSELFDRGSGARLGAGISHPTAPDRTQAARVTDKAPFNHIRLGLIHLLRVPELFRRLAQPARFAQWTEIDSAERRCASFETAAAQLPQDEDISRSYQTYLMLRGCEGIGIDAYFWSPSRGPSAHGLGSVGKAGTHLSTRLELFMH